MIFFSYQLLLPEIMMHMLHKLENCFKSNDQGDKTFQGPGNTGNQDFELRNKGTQRFSS